MSEQAPRFDREKKTLQAMIRIYCSDLHKSGDSLCAECAALEAYALMRLDKCTFGENKPKCADCPIHCYKPAMREEIRKVMKYAGPRMMLKHPGMAISHVIDGMRHPAKKAVRKMS